MKAPLPGAAGIQPEQGPPLSVVAPFFVLAPICAALGGLVLVVRGGAPFATPWTPDSIALTHLATLGLLATCMIGALYQLGPTVAGAPIRPARLAHGVQVLLPVGLAGLVGGMLLGVPPMVVAGGSALGLASVAFVVPALVALLRSEVRTDTARGLRLSVSAFAVVAGLGMLLAMARGAHGVVLPGTPAAWRTAHLLLGLLVWVGGLVSAVAWQVLPMFYTAPDPPPRLTRTMLVLQSTSLVGLPVAAALGGIGWVLAAALPAGISVGVLLPAWGIRALRSRRRRRADHSVHAWTAGLAVAVAAAVVGAVAGATTWPALDVLFVWLATWGAAGLVMHGMLSRIVPFLVWFHRMSPLLGRAPVPPMRQLYAQTRLARTLIAHGSSVVLGSVAILTGSGALARLTGVLVLATGMAWAVDVVRVLATPAPPLTGGP